jgi:tripartite-type tricarboxylate transporter receptor subunit TctC
MRKIKRAGPVLVLALLGVLSTASASLTSADEAAAQTDFPTRTVNLIVGFAAGTAVDVSARALARELSKSWDQPVVVENVPGASGNIAGNRVARSDPDGYTLLLAANSGVVINPLLYRNMPFDPLKDLAPVSIAFSYPNVLVAHKDVGAKNVAELVAIARARPGELTCASAGIGTTQHLSCEMLKTMAGIDIVHLPYSGATNLLTDVVAGRAHIMFGAPAILLAYARDGKVNALAVSSARRFAGAPGIPTLAESGFPEFDVSVWWGILAPAGTPEKILEKLNQGTVNALASPELKQLFDKIGVEIVASSREQFAATIEAELPKWKKIVEAAAIKLE